MYQLSQGLILTLFFYLVTESYTDITTGDAFHLIWHIWDNVDLYFHRCDHDVTPDSSKLHTRGIKVMKQSGSILWCAAVRLLRPQRTEQFPPESRNIFSGIQVTVMGKWRPGTRNNTFAHNRASKLPPFTWNPHYKGSASEVLSCTMSTPRFL